MEETGSNDSGEPLESLSIAYIKFRLEYNRWWSCGGREKQLAKDKKENTKTNELNAFLPKECSYLEGQETVETDKKKFDAIRKKATTGKAENIKFQFRGNDQNIDALRRSVTIDNVRINVVTSKDPELPQGISLPTSEQIVEALGAVPSNQLKKIRTVVVNPNRRAIAYGISLWQMCKKKE